MSSTICTDCGRDIRAGSDCPWCATEVTIYQTSFPLQAIVTKYHNMTAKSDARVSARCSAGRIFLPWDKEISREENYRAAVRALCAKFNWKGPLVHGMLDDGSHVFVQTSEIAEQQQPTTTVVSTSEVTECPVCHSKDRSAPGMVTRGDGFPGECQHTWHWNNQ